MSSTYKAVDSKKEEFRKYLEKTGVLDTLTNVLVSLYEEPQKPTSALEFLKTHIPDTNLVKSDISELRNEIDNLK